MQWRQGFKLEERVISLFLTARGSPESDEFDPPCRLLCPSRHRKPFRSLSWLLRLISNILGEMSCLSYWGPNHQMRWFALPRTSDLSSWDWVRRHMLKSHLRKPVSRMVGDYNKISSLCPSVSEERYQRQPYKVQTTHPQANRPFVFAFFLKFLMFY